MSLRAIIGIPLLAYAFTFTNPCSQSARTKALAPHAGDQVFDVKVISPKLVSVPRLIEADGVFEPSEIQTIRTPVDGIVTQVYVSVGDSVEKGDPLVALSSEDLEDRLDLAKAQLKETNARLKLAQAKLDDGASHQEPVSDDDVAFLDEDTDQPADKPTNVDDATAAPENLGDLIDVLNARATALAAKTDLLQKRLLDLTIKSPIDGTVLSCDRPEQAAVKLDDVLATIAQTQPLSVAFHVPSSDASFVDKHSSVTVTLPDAPGVKSTGVVAFLSPDLDAGVSGYLLKAHIDNPEGKIKGGEKALVAIESRRRDTTVALPKSVVIDEGQKSYLFAVAGQRARIIEVHKGRDLDSDHIEVKADLGVDDQVILNHPAELKNGSFVHIAAVIEDDVKIEDNKSDQVEQAAIDQPQTQDQQAIAPQSADLPATPTKALSPNGDTTNPPASDDGADSGF